MAGLMRHTYGWWESLLAILLLTVVSAPPSPAPAGLPPAQSPQWQADDEGAPQFGSRQAHAAKNPLVLYPAARPYATAFLLAGVIAASLRLFDANIAKRMKRLLLKPVKFMAIFIGFFRHNPMRPLYKPLSMTRGC